MYLRRNNCLTELCVPELLRTTGSRVGRPSTLKYDYDDSSRTISVGEVLIRHNFMDIGSSV